MSAAAITSTELRNTAQFGTPLRADTVRQLADQQDALLDALAGLLNPGYGGSHRHAERARDLLRAHGRPA